MSIYKKMAYITKDTPKFCFKEVIPLLFAVFIDILGFGLSYPVFTTMFAPSSGVLPLNTPENLRLFYLGLGFMLYPLFMLFGSSFMGDLSDRLGRRRVILLCMAGLAAGFFLIGLGVASTILPLIFIGRALSGLMAASSSVVLAAISDLSSGKDKAVHMSYVGLVQCLGFVVGPLMGGVLSDPKLVSFFNFSLPFFLSSFLALVAFGWIYLSFIETFEQKTDQKIDFFRIFKNFSDAAKDRKIRLLSIAFFLMQIAVALYIQLIFLYYKGAFHYENATMGIFNAYLGFWCAIGLLVIIPLVAHRFSIEKVAVFFLLIACLSELGISFSKNESLLWIFGAFFSLAIEVGFTAMLTSFSNGSNKEHQGWVMGVSGAVMALAFAITGLSPTLIPLFGIQPIIFGGALCMGLGSFLMLLYSTRFSKHKNVK